MLASAVKEIILPTYALCGILVSKYGDSFPHRTFKDGGRVGYLVCVATMTISLGSDY
jgi:hypothetical protein